MESHQIFSLPASQTNWTAPADEDISAIIARLEQADVAPPERESEQEPERIGSFSGEEEEEEETGALVIDDFGEDDEDNDYVQSYFDNGEAYAHEDDVGGAADDPFDWFAFPHVIAVLISSGVFLHDLRTLDSGSAVSETLTVKILAVLWDWLNLSFLKFHSVLFSPFKVLIKKMWGLVQIYQRSIKEKDKICLIIILFLIQSTYYWTMSLFK